MRKLFVVITVISISLAGEAQTAKTQVGAGIRLGRTVGDYKKFFSSVFGAELQVEHRFSSKISGLFTTGHFRYFGKEVDGFNVDHTGMIPVLVGARVYPLNSLFVGGRFGLGIVTKGTANSAFNYEPQIGYNREKFQLTLGYNARPEDNLTLAHLGLSAILKFN